jgi:hypothetical protein
MRFEVLKGDNLLEGNNLQDCEELYNQLIDTIERILEILKGNIKIYYILIIVFIIHLLYNNCFYCAIVTFKLRIYTCITVIASENTYISKFNKA